MSKSDSDGDHMPQLSPETVEEYFRGDSAVAFTMSSLLQARLEIDPLQNQIRLVCPAVGGTPDLSTLERIDVERLNVLGELGDWFQLTINAAGIHYEAYVLVESVVEKLRSGATFRHAVSEALATYKDLLANRRAMTDEVVTGLIGELLILQHSIAQLSEDEAMLTWLGPENEEHDFVFRDFDAEVKTTKSEARVHRVGSESQLQPSAARPLFLVSVQITQAGAAVEAFSLSMLVSSCRRLLTENLRAFDAHIRGLGWADEDADLYAARYLLRGPIRAYRVDGSFPAITPGHLAAVVPQSTLVSGVSYRVDVSHLPFELPPAPLTNLCEEPE